MSGHTPGPWHYAHRERDGGFYTDVYAADGETIATFKWVPKPPDERGWIGTYREANARLVSAAPDLLSACNAVLGIVVATAQHDDTPLLKLIRGAIAKAQGEETP